MHAVNADRSNRNTGASAPARRSGAVAGRAGAVLLAVLLLGLAVPSALAIDPDRTRPMNLDVQGADIRGVLRSIAEFGQMNIIPDREIEGPITVSMNMVPWRRALDVVCQSAGLIALDQDDVIRVATLTAWRQEGIERETAARKNEELQPLMTRIFTARYAAAAELKEAIAFALSTRGSAQVDGRTNAVLVNDIETRLSEVERIITALDSETRQVEIVARLVDVDNTVSRQLGIDWSLENLHSSSQRVSGSVAVHEGLAQPSGIGRFGLVRGWGNLDATIEAMEQNNQAHIISNPKITTVNNRKARILVGKEVPLIVLDEAGNPVTELKKVGITLEVTPYINNENRITMDLHPEVSDLSSQATVQGGIIFTTTLADTRVMVNNGETAVIGGLIRTNETKFREGIPILGSIPLIGNLFSHTEVRHENRELLIFVTPRVVEPMASNQR